jgi:hypothetical protein
MINPDDFIDPYLTTPDLLVLENLLRDIDRSEEKHHERNGEKSL